MSGDYVDVCRHKFFAEVFSGKHSVQELITYFYGYAGTIYNDQIEVLLKALNRLDALNPWTEADLFSNSNGLGARACAVLGKSAGELYFSPVEHSIFTWKLFAQNPNEFRSARLPLPLCQGLPRQDRPEFNLHHIAADAIFLSPNNFFVMDRASRTYWPLAATRRFPASVAEVVSSAVKGQAVLIQDRGHGANFAHFLLDSMLRLVWFCERVGNACDYTFIMGGYMTEFHREVLGCVRDWLNLPESCFYWPQREETLSLAQGIFAFSDTVRHSAHPAYMMHPDAMRVIDEIASRLRIEPGADARVYVSRGDAALRRIANEEALVEKLTAMKYRSVKLAELSMAGAKSIIAPHGMGLTHLALRGGSLDMLELFHPKHGSDAYAFLAGAKRFSHGFLVGRELGDMKADYEIDVEQMLNFAKIMA
jgi:hypothetical protein